MLTGWKKLPELAFLSDAYTDNLQQKLKDLHGAWIRCFDKNWQRKRPCSNSKNNGNDSVRFVNFDKYCQLEYRRVKLPSGLGWVTFRQSSAVVGKIKNATVSQHAGGWYISFQVEMEVETARAPVNVCCRLDAGICKLVTLSDGTVFEPVNSFKKPQEPKQTGKVTAPACP